MKKPLYKRLNDLSLIICTNLPAINDVEYIKEVLDIIQDTRVSIYSNIFEDSLEYYKTHKSFPDFEYIEMHFPELIEELEGEEPAFHTSFPEEYLKLLKRDRFLQRINEATSNDDAEKIATITSNEVLFTIDEKRLKTWADLWVAQLRLKNTKEPLSFGVRELDEIYRGLCHGTLNILAAPPGKFKTTTLCSIAYKNFTQGKKVLFITLEDSWDIIYYNFAAREAYEEDRILSAANLKIGRLDEFEEETFETVWKTCKEKYDDYLRVACQETWDDFSPSGLLRLIKQVEKELNGLDLVIVDHASLFKFYPIKGIGDSKEVINYYLRYLTNLSLSFKEKFALLVAMQTNREGIKELEAGKTGSLTNLAEANEAERSASTVTLIYSGPNQVESNIINFFIKKNRRGALTAKPIISFIEASAYFVGEKAVAGDVDLDDLLDDMSEEPVKKIKQKIALPTEKSQKEEIKEPEIKTSKKSYKNDKIEQPSTVVKTKRLRRINK